MSKFLIAFFSILFCFAVSAQRQVRVVEDTVEIERVPATAVVHQHKNNLRLTLVIDSIIFGERKILPDFRITIPINFESGYIRVKDSLYIKIFIARNQEYGNKFYTWKWDFLKRRSDQYLFLGGSFYEVMDFNGSLDRGGSEGVGIGTQGDDDYIMYYYRYKLE
ncbi:MAG TPA: hypothetical protein VG890_07365 [Puia sp.]|nr:hypothetical protein [Puia sp.]